MSKCLPRIRAPPLPITFLIGRDKSKISASTYSHGLYGLLRTAKLVFENSFFFFLRNNEFEQERKKCSNNVEEIIPIYVHL